MDYHIHKIVRSLNNFIKKILSKIELTRFDYRDYSDDELRELGFSLLQENGYDEKFQGIECLVKTIPSFNPDHLHQLERFHPFLF